MSLRETARRIFLSTLAQLDVSAVLRRKVRCDRGVLHVLDAAYRLDTFRRIKVVGVGKAAAPMAEALMQTIRPHLSPAQPMEGIVVGTRTAHDPHLRTFLGGHPLPNEQSWQAAGAILDFLSATDVQSGERPDDCLVLFLISGGASALLERPLDPGMTLADTVAFHQVLVHSGLNIGPMNVLRKHLSAVKGGRLAVAAGAATQCTLLISDVPGEDLHIIGSGPTLPDPSTLADCRDLLKHHHAALPFSDKVLGLFANGTLPETPKQDHPAFLRSSSFALLSSDDLAAEAAALAKQQGFHVVVDHACDEWEYARAAAYLLERIEQLSAQHSKVCLVSAGEVSVQVEGAHGLGGRNQHFVLECARRIAQTAQQVTVLSGGSDGMDGNSPAAGGIADQTTVSRAASLGLDVPAALAAFDSYHVLSALGDTLVTGPSGNNVRDLRLLLADRTSTPHT